MTVSSQTSRVSYAGNGSTTAFAVSFYFLADSHLKVILRAADGSETVKTLTADYTVSGAGNPSGGTVTMNVAPTSGATLVIVRNVPLTQETDYQANDDFPAESHERALDKLTMEVQQLQEQVDRSAKLPVTNPTDADALVADIVRLADSADNIDTVANNIVDVNKTGDNIVNVNTVGNNITNVNTTAANIANVNAVGSDLLEPVSEINTVAVNIADVNTVGTNIADVNTVATNIADVGTVADNIADVVIAADNVADINNFADVYQGAKATDPTLRNNGSALRAGDMYFNTTLDELRIYTGVYWNDSSPGGVGNIVGLSRLSGNGSTVTFALGVTPIDENHTQVFINGIYQQKNTYSVAGANITFDAAPPTGTDNIEIVVVDASADAQLFSGNGSTTAFTLATAPGGKNNTQVYINGIYQQKSSYSVVGLTLTFDEAPPSGTNNIEVIIMA